MRFGARFRKCPHYVKISLEAPVLLGCSDAADNAGKVRSVHIAEELSKTVKTLV